jgi:carboxypeptidase C (cathepsin A)
MKKRVFLVLSVLLLLLCAFGAAEEELAVPETKTDHVVVTDQTAMINGKYIPYTATAGTMLMDTAMGRYEIFYTAYVTSNVDYDKPRPITFCFNGGPGASSVYLHMGFLGPRRISLDATGNVTKLPAELVDNEISLLDMTDLVFIDPVGTGYSRVLEGTEVDAFYTDEGDTVSVGDFIRQYVNQNKRWSSPKYLIGESYGTVRAVNVCNYLAQQHKMYLNGIVLVSSANDFSTMEFGGVNDLPYELYIPTYAADAWYHKLTDVQYQEMTLEDYMAEVRKFVAGTYAPALFKGRSLSDAEREKVAEQLSGYIGVSKDFILKKDLRIDLDTFLSELLADRKQIVGRMDGRITGPVTAASGEMDQPDPSVTGTDLGFGTAVSQYLTEELNYQTDRPYEVLSNVIEPSWKYTTPRMGYLNQEKIISQIMGENPFLKVWVLCGYYDGATPFHAAEWVYDHTSLNEKSLENLMFTYYPSGHMIYLEEGSRAQFRKEAEAWFGLAN